MPLPPIRILAATRDRLVSLERRLPWVPLGIAYAAALGGLTLGLAGSFGTGGATQLARVLLVLLVLGTVVLLGLASGRLWSARRRTGKHRVETAAIATVAQR